MHGSMNTARLKLQPVLDLGAAEEFLGALRGHLETAPRLVLDASAVETLTLPCVQIILSARRSHGEVFVENPSVAFIAAFADLGLDWTELCGAPDGEPIQADADGTPIGDAESTEIPMQEPAMARRILTIDDSKTIRDMLMLTLADAGFEVLQAVDGQDGLDMLDKERVDVVITDINMPRMDGYEVIRQMRANAALKSMPVLVLTTESEAEKRNLARAAGATGWMVKPFDPDRLIATINKVAP
jgi:two-component system, chemotaxis family, chemotaxis protein CheY